MGCSPARALIGFWTKHVVSIMDIVNRIDRGENVDSSTIDEKITDAICYLLLLDATLRDSESDPENVKGR
ncbi:MAG: hypothetical protein N3G75_08725 [Methanothrix sp.]|nr:hypothetical protein [Methanothrix sp.]MCX8207892.1 hypothetical protein [Methanothrix sp.]